MEAPKKRDLPGARHLSITVFKWEYIGTSQRMQISINVQLYELNIFQNTKSSMQTWLIFVIKAEG